MHLSAISKWSMSLLTVHLCYCKTRFILTKVNKVEWNSVRSLFIKYEIKWCVCKYIHTIKDVTSQIFWKKNCQRRAPLRLFVPSPISTPGCISPKKTRTLFWNTLMYIFIYLHKISLSQLNKRLKLLKTSKCTQNFCGYKYIFKALYD